MIGYVFRGDFYYCFGSSEVIVVFVKCRVILAVWADRVAPGAAC